MFVQEMRWIDNDVSNEKRLNPFFFSALLLHRWNVSKVEVLSFFGAAAFNQPLNEWDTSSVVRMNQGFKDATNFNQDISAWDTSKVTTMRDMFSKAFRFNRRINEW